MKKTHEFACRNLEVGYDSRTIIQGINASIPPGKVTVIIGNNGCGKSTLLKSFARLLKPFSGGVYLDEKDIQDYPPKDLAKKVGLLPQSPLLPQGIRVADLVSRGRYPHRQALKGLSQDDYRAIHRAMELTRTSELADRYVEALSGGQRQRVWIAMALAQETDILLLDEPTTYLDIAYQLEVLNLLQDLNREEGVTIAMVLHDINFAARYADYMIALHDGKIVAEGTAQEVVCREVIREVFDMDARIMEDPVVGSPMVVPIGLDR